MKDLHAWRFWGYAASFGALWGAVEITVGTFLNAVKVPFSGVVLAGVGAALLVALRSLLPVRGVCVTAGLVCAGVKMLSPAGAIIGPMAAILMESMLVEASSLPAGANPVSGAVAGGLCSLWAVAQKLITQTLFYGLPMIGIYKGILQQAERVLHLPAAGGGWAAAGLLCLAALIGAMLGATGALVGRATSRQLSAEGA